MEYMKKFTTLLLALLVAFSFTAMSSSAKTTAAPGTWSGTLIDKHCGSHMAADKLAAHEKACAMKCAKDGKDLGMVVDGKWYAFDKKGEKLGWSILKKSKADANIQVNVEGKLKGDKITVTKMSEKA